MCVAIMLCLLEPGLPVVVRACLFDTNYSLLRARSLLVDRVAIALVSCRQMWR